MNKLLLFLLLFQTPQPDWKLTTNQAGIYIYTGTTSAKQVKPIKVECALKASPAQLLAVLLDIKSYPEWVYHTKSATLVKQFSPQDLYYYSEVNIPWPGQNRDFVSHVTVTKDVQTGEITVDAPNVEGFIPEKKGIVRTHTSRGRWIITPDGTGSVKVVYYLQIDAGTGAPTWMVNLFVTEGPLQTFKNLRLQLQKARYL